MSELEPIETNEETKDMKVAVSLSVGYKPLEPQIDNILEVCTQNNVTPIVVLAGHSTLDPHGSESAEKAASNYSGTVVTAFANQGSFSAAYLAGWETGAEIADYVISMDSDGAHDHKEIVGFLNAFKSGHDVTLASRFLPEGINNYPLQRKLVSEFGTYIANTLLTPSGMPKLTDYTSGFEGVKSEIVKHLFEKYPPNNWISVVKGPYHLQNTELRMKLMLDGNSIHEVPISYGIEKKGKNLKMQYLFEAFAGFVLLMKQKNA